MKFPGLGDGPCQSVAKTERCSCKRDFAREKLGLPVEDLRLCERPLEVVWEALEVHFLKKRVFCWEAPNTGSAVLDSESCPFPTSGRPSNHQPDTGHQQCWVTDYGSHSKLSTTGIQRGICFINHFLFFLSLRKGTYSQCGL